MTRSIAKDAAELRREATAPARAHTVTELLGRVRQGDRAASNELMTLVYADLWRLADLYLSRERPGQTVPRAPSQAAAAPTANYSAKRDHGLTSRRAGSARRRARSQRARMGSDAAGQRIHARPM